MKNVHSLDAITVTENLHDTSTEASQKEASSPPLCSFRGIFKALFPYSKFASFTFIIFLTNICFFIIGSIKYYQSADPNWPCTMYSLGSKFTSDIRYKHEFERLIMPVFLHSSLFHLIYNNIMLLFGGFFAEHILGTFQTMILYISSAIFSYSFSSIMAPNEISVGASGAVLSLTAFYAYFYIMNFSLLSKMDRCSFICSVLLTIGNFLMPIGIPGKTVDPYGHFGGFVSGLMLSIFMLSENINGKSFGIGKWRYLILFTYILMEAGQIWLLYNMKIPEVEVCQVPSAEK